jgi:hypothetical protein
MCIQGLGKIWKHCGYCTYFFIDLVFDRLLPSLQAQSFLEWTRTSFEQAPMEFYTIILEEHLQVALEMVVVGICTSL